MHTDIQEYLGSYVPDRDGGGKLVFQEGVLVEAVRNGYWVILDELNLAPSEVLEALNRLLDDNRELLIVETQKVIKAHPNFRIFATQNPTEGYGGRKELSEAFKNRFILINVHDVPLLELVEILIHKCQ
jgi:midasin